MRKRALKDRAVAVGWVADLRRAEVPVPCTRRLMGQPSRSGSCDGCQRSTTVEGLTVRLVIANTRPQHQINGRSPAEAPTQLAALAIVARLAAAAVRAPRMPPLRIVLQKVEATNVSAHSGPFVPQKPYSSAGTPPSAAPAYLGDTTPGRGRTCRARLMGGARRPVAPTPRPAPPGSGRRIPPPSASRVRLARGDRSMGNRQAGLSSDPTHASRVRRRVRRAVPAAASWRCWGRVRYGVSLQPSSINRRPCHEQ